MRPHRQPRPSELPPAHAPGGVGTSVPGFTLIELMVVIGLIGIMTAMVIPEMRGSYYDALLRSGSRDLIAVCSIAASRAVSFNQPHRVRVDPATRRFRVERRLGRGQGQGRGTGAPEFVPVREVPGCEGTYDDRITLRVRPGGVVRPSGDAVPEPAAGEEERGGAGREDPAGETETRRPAQDVMFYPDGTADRVEFVLRDREGFTVTLRVNPITARVRVVPSEGVVP